VSYPTDRDALARHLYIHAHDNEGATDAWRDAGAVEWDSGDISEEDRIDCYAQADRILAGDVLAR